MERCSRCSNPVGSCRCSSVDLRLAAQAPHAGLLDWASTPELFREARVLVVDDLAANVVLLQRMLAGAGVGEISSLTDSRLVVEQCQTWHPDLILLDLHMPNMDGVAVLEMLRATLAPDVFVPVLMLTADVTGAARERALAAGAQDFVTKPFDRVEVLLRARNLLATRSLYVEMQRRQELQTATVLTRDRERIARDLHDSVIQQLFGEALGLHSFIPLVQKAVGERLTSTVDVLDQAIKDLRMAIFALQGPVGAPGGLRGRLLAVVTEAGGALGFEPRLQFDGPVETIQSDIGDELVNVLREALSNVAQHSKARRVRVAVEVSRDIVLTVIDDGIGVPAERFGGRGLANMASRADRLGGAFAVANRPAGGAAVTWTVPHEASSERQTTSSSASRTVDTP
ncbi:MAG: putative two-component system sensor kinase [Ilumatobacteraceae bacterium]|nr:putative two-component system sensor kinase [Ilumatobacteraceae bacterium]